MNEDARKLAEFGEQARHNREMEAASAKQADAAALSARAKMKGARYSGLTGILRGLNDADGWYDPKTGELSDAGKISFVQFATGCMRKGAAFRKSPALLKLHMLQTIGIGTYSNLVTSAKRIYDIVRGNNRGATNYTLNDVIVYLFTLMCLGVHMTAYDRAIKTYESPDPVNAITIKQMLEAQGFDYASFAQHLPSIKDRVNRTKAVINALKLPVDFPIFQRWTWLTSFIFMDDAHQIKQYYLAGFDVRHRPQGNNDPHYVTHCETTAFGGSDSGVWDWDRICTDLNTVDEDAIYLEMNTTYQAIAGDMENAFGKDKMVAVAPYSDWKDDPYIIDDEFLLQVKNAWITKIAVSTVLSVTFQCGLKLDEDGRLGQGFYNSLGQFSGMFASLPEKLAEANAAHPTTVFKDDDDGDLKPVEVIMATRFHPELDQAMHQGITGYYYDPTTHALTSSEVSIAAAGDKLLQINTGGTEIINSMTICYYDGYYQPAGDPDYKQTVGSISLISNQVKTSAVQYTAILGMRSVKALPPFVMIDSTLDSDLIWLNNTDTIATVTRDALAGMHRTANLGLWGYATLKAKDKTYPGKKPFHKGKKEKDKNPAPQPNPEPAAK